MEPTFAIKVSLKKSLELPMLIAHLPIITMQMSTPERNKQVGQSLMLMMTIRIQMMLIYWCALFVLKQKTLTEIEDCWYRWTMPMPKYLSLQFLKIPRFFQPKPWRHTRWRVGSKNRVRSTFFLLNKFVFLCFVSHCSHLSFLRGVEVSTHIHTLLSYFLSRQWKPATDLTQPYSVVP